MFDWRDRRNEPGPNGQGVRRADGHPRRHRGSRTYEHAGHWQGDHHDGVPVFVLIDDVPDDPPPGSVRYVTEVREGTAQARAVGGRRGRRGTAGTAGRAT